MQIKMSITANGSDTQDMEKECSRRDQLEELKEDSMLRIKSKKFLKSFRKVNEHHHTEENKE